MAQYPRVITLLNYLGALNMIGIIAILLTENSQFHSPSPPSTMMMTTTTSSSSSCQGGKTKPFRKSPTNGRNMTLWRLKQLGVNVSKVVASRLPSWWMIEQQYGTGPKILGLDQCHNFQRANRHRVDQIIMGPAGMFNSGTNLLSLLMQQNCYFSQRPTDVVYHGKAFQVPWGKHTPSRFRRENTIEHPLYQSMIVDAVLPIVMVRHPYDWMASMCQQPYAVHWGESVERLEGGAGFRRLICPELVNVENMTQEVVVTYGVGNHTHETLAHLWNEWYRGYYSVMAYPRLVVRLEDLIFFPNETIHRVCGCAGARVTKEFRLLMESAKAELSGHKQGGTNLLDAYLRYGKPRNYDYFPRRDIVAAKQILDKELMEVFGYEHPD